MPAHLPTAAKEAASCPAPSSRLPPTPLQVHMSEHLIEGGLYLFKYLRQLQVEACYDGSFPLQVP